MPKKNMDFDDYADVSYDPADVVPGTSFGNFHLFFHGTDSCKEELKLGKRYLKRRPVDWYPSDSLRGVSRKRAYQTRGEFCSEILRTLDELGIDPEDLAQKLSGRRSGSWTASIQTMNKLLAPIYEALRKKGYSCGDFGAGGSEKIRTTRK